MKKRILIIIVTSLFVSLSACKADSKKDDVYSISVYTEGYEGKVELNKTQAHSGEEIIITPLVEDEHVVDSISFSTTFEDYDKKEPIPSETKLAKNNEDGTYSFVMPESNVSVIVTISKTISYPIELSEEEIQQWINDYSGNYTSGENANCYGNEFDVICVDIHQPSQDWDYNIYQFTCCINDGVVYDIDKIYKEDEAIYSLHLKRTTIREVFGFQNFTMFPTDTYLIRDSDTNDGEFELQFVGVNKSTLDSFTGELERGEYFKGYPQLYKDEDEWYLFTKDKTH